MTAIVCHMNICIKSDFILDNIPFTVEPDLKVTQKLLV